MKKILLMIIVSLFALNFEAKSQVAASLYNVNRDDFNQHNKKERFLKGVIVTGILIGGLVLANEARHHDYYVNNTMIYGVGGIMVILATGLVISSVNYLNRQIDFAYTGKGIMVRITI